ncbi:MAG: carph-isopro domain-containing protein [Alphaproteobacteria bacterium]
MQVEQIISKLGGIRPTASKLGVAVSTVQGWKERNHIPVGRRKSIEDILGQDIFTNDVDENVKNNNEYVQVTENIENNSEKPKNNNFILYLSLFLSVLAVVLSVTSHLWRGIVFPEFNNNSKIDSNLNLQSEIYKIKQKMAIFDKKTAKMDKKVIKMGKNDEKPFLNIEAFVKDVNTNIDKFQQELDKSSVVIKKNSDGLNSILESSNEKVIKVRQIVAVALSGEDFSLLLRGIYSDNPDVQKALSVLEGSNKSGIYTKQMLIKYINDNILALSEHINYKNAKTPLEKIKAKISGAIYIRSKENNDKISDIINYVKQDDFDKIIDLLEETNSKHSNNLKQLIIARKNTLVALNALTDWTEQE